MTPPRCLARLAAPALLLAVLLPATASADDAPGTADALAASLGMERQVVELTADDGAPMRVAGAAARPLRGIGPGWSARVRGLDVSTVMLTFIGAKAGSLEVQVRSHGPGGWSRAVDLHASPDEAPDAGAEGVISPNVVGPIWTGHGTDQLIVTIEEGFGSKVVVEGLDLDDPLGSGSPQPAMSPRGATPPQILGPGAWGSPGWSYGTSGCEGGPSVAPLQLAIVHHTVSTNDYSAADTAAVIRSIYYYHRSRGWCDIAYNYLVDRFGRTWQGRSGPGNAAVVGGHAAGFNTGSVGVALLGQHQPGANPAASVPSSAQLDAVANVIAWKFTLHGLDPTSQTNYTARNGSSRFPEGTIVRLERVSGHRDTGQTSCPGDYAYTRLGEVRTRALQRTSSPASFSYGGVGETVLWGDWNGDGRADPAVRRGNKYLMRFSASGGPADLTVSFGRVSDLVIVGDWDGDGTDTIGVHRGGNIYLTSRNEPQGHATSTFRYGVATDVPVSGDWDGDGVDGIGVRRGNQWLLRQNAGGGNAQIAFSFGRHSDSALVGDWDGDGTDTVGVWRSGTAYTAAQHAPGPHVAVQPVDGPAEMVLAGDPTGRGFDMLGGVDGNRWTPWRVMPHTS